MSPSSCPSNSFSVIGDILPPQRTRRRAEELPAKLEQTMGLGKNSWPLAAIRQMADAFLAAADGRKKSPAFEMRWLNLAGFCLRPGFGYPGDDFRIEQTRRIYASGLTYGNPVQCEIVYQRISGFLLPRASRSRRG